MSKVIEKYKKRFYYSCFARMLATALIPIVSLASEVNWSSVIVSILAGVIAITAKTAPTQ